MQQNVGKSAPRQRHALSAGLAHADAVAPAGPFKVGSIDETLLAAFPFGLEKRGCAAHQKAV